LLSLIFLVHPANEEIVAYIGALQDVLFFFFGMCSLCLIIKTNGKIIPTLILSSLLVLFSLFSKETGVLFLFIIPVYVFIFQRQRLKYYLASFACVGAVYLSLRIIASRSVMFYLLNSPIQHMSLGQRAIIMPKILYSYFKELFFPSISLPDFTYLQSTNIMQSVFPFLVVVSLLFFLAVFGYLIYKYRKPAFPALVFFTIWMLLGFGAHSQILPLDVIFATRWMYFPLAGALGILGICLGIIKSWPVKYKKIMLIALVLYICFFVLATERISFIRMNEGIKANQTL